MNYAHENELLLSVARREAPSLVRQQLDWDYVVTTARAHGLLPLLQKYLTNTTVSGHVLSCLKREAVANSQSMLHLVGKQLRVYNACQEHGIPVAIFKGAILAQMAYGEMCLRQAGDIDVLINGGDFAQGRGALESLGFGEDPPP